MAPLDLCHRKEENAVERVWYYFSVQKVLERLFAKDTRDSLFTEDLKQGDPSKIYYVKIADCFPDGEIDPDGKVLYIRKQGNTIELEFLKEDLEKLNKHLNVFTCDRRYHFGYFDSVKYRESDIDEEVNRNPGQFIKIDKKLRYGMPVLDEVSEMRIHYVNEFK